MCIGELVGIGKRRSIAKIDSIANSDDSLWTNSSIQGLDYWKSLLCDDTVASQTPRDVESIRQMIRQVCRRRRPGRPPLYVFSERGAGLKTEEEKKFMERILKRRIRQNKAYRRKKERTASKKNVARESSQEAEECTTSESIFKTAQVSTSNSREDLEQENLYSFVSANDEKVSANDESYVSSENVDTVGKDNSICGVFHGDEYLHLKHIWETEEQWIEIDHASGSFALIRLIFDRVRETYLRLNMFYRDAYKSLSIIPGYFDWQTACYVIGIFSKSEQPDPNVLQPLLHCQIIQSKNDCFLMGPLERSFALNSSFIRNEEQYEDVMCRAKERFVEYFLSRFSEINDYLFLKRGTAKDVVLSIYENEKVNMDYCLKLIMENDTSEMLNMNLLNSCIHFFRYCAAPETLIAIFNKVLDQRASLRYLTLETCTDDIMFSRTPQCLDSMHPYFWEIETITRINTALGEAYCNVGDNENGESFFREALQLCKYYNIIDSLVVVLPLLYLANLEKKQTYYSTAVEKLHTAVNVLYRWGLRNSPFVPVALVSGAMLEAQMGNMKFVKDSIAVIEDLPYSKDLPEVNTFLGFSYQVQGKQEIARQYFRNAIEIIQRKEFSQNVSEFYLKHCAKSSLKDMLLCEMEDSCVEETTESYINDVTAENSPEERVDDFQSNCNDGLGCFCFDLGKFGKTLRKFFSFVLSYEDTSGEEGACIDDALEDQDEIIFNHPFFIA